MIDQKKLEESTKLFLEGLGLDPTDQHLVDTPKRVARAWKEAYGAGYEIDPKQYLTTEFSDNFDQMIVVKQIPVFSHCIHHIVSFSGVAKIGYIPNLKTKKITGLSKLARVLNGYAQRLQIQEQLTRQVTEAINEVLEPRGCGTVIEASHNCMCSRGVRAPGSLTVTSYLLGEFRDNLATRQEFLNF